ncbi:MAG: toprim domain-containing protein [Firmicutes bacterium]|nr:toprim domain-containing protein [Bacillota bacterium]
MRNKHQNYSYEKFIKAKPSHPCPICGKADWCGFNSYLASCMRVKEGAFKTVVQSNGKEAYLHWLGSKCIDIPAVKQKESVPAAQTALVEIRDRVYRDFLRLLNLSERHRADLISRGLSERDIKANSYKSIPEREKPWNICRRLMDKGYDLSGIPGFFRVRGPYGGMYWTFNCQPGYYIPVLDSKGRIKALQRRMDEPEKGGKYKLFSGYTNRGGCSCGTPAHIARPNKTNDSRVWITEGPLKSDIAAKYLGAVVVASISSSAWRPVVDEVINLRATEAVIAYDMDSATNVYVAQAEKSLKQELHKYGLKVTRATWKNGKGIDDALVSVFRSKSVIKMSC